MGKAYVLDASVAVRWFVPAEQGHRAARRVLALTLAGQIRLVAPKNLLYEFSGSVVRHFRKEGRTEADIVSAISDFLQVPIEYKESTPHLIRAARLSHRFDKTFYDMLYFAVGEEEDLPVCTGDKKSVAELRSDFPCTHIFPEDVTDH